MAGMTIPVYLEIGSKKTFASALEWPGWSRSGASEEAALQALAAYADRYAAVATAAEVRFSAPRQGPGSFEVIERVPGSSTTDFGAPGEPAARDSQPLGRSEAERLGDLLAAAWAVFDKIAASAPQALRKGPRGGGRDRDQVVDHVLGAEQSYARSLGVRFRQPSLGDREGIVAARQLLLEALRTARAPSPELPRGWPYRYAARRIAWHVLDHGWEIEDRSETFDVA